MSVFKDALDSVLELNVKAVSIVIGSIIVIGVGGYFAIDAGAKLAKESMLENIACQTAAGKFNAAMAQADKVPTQTTALLTQIKEQEFVYGENSSRYPTPVIIPDYIVVTTQSTTADPSGLYDNLMGIYEEFSKNQKNLPSSGLADGCKTNGDAQAITQAADKANQLVTPLASAYDNLSSDFNTYEREQNARLAEAAKFERSQDNIAALQEAQRIEDERLAAEAAAEAERIRLESEAAQQAADEALRAAAEEALKKAQEEAAKKAAEDEAKKAAENPETPPAG